MSRAPEHRPRLLRAARPDDLAELSRAAFRASRLGSVEEWRASLGDDPRLAGEATLVHEERGAIVGQASALALRMRLAGAEVPVRGLTALAVAPEHRRRGIGRSLVEAWLLRLHEERTGIVLAYPHRAPFYSSLGFGRCEWLEEIWAAPRELPDSPQRSAVRVLDLGRDRALLARIHAEAIREATGPFARSSWWWERRLLAGALEGAVHEGEGGPGGYVLYEIPRFAKSSGTTCVVRELAASTPEALRGLLGFLRALGDQVAKVSIVLPHGEASMVFTGEGPERPLAHLPAHRKLGHYLAGAMGRIVHLETALTSHPGAARSGAPGRLGLDLEDPVLSAQHASFDLELDGELRVRRGAASRERIALSVGRLSAIVMGAASAGQLLRAGFATGSPRAAELLDRVFAGPMPFLWPLDAF